MLETSIPETSLTDLSITEPCLTEPIITKCPYVNPMPDIPHTVTRKYINTNQPMHAKEVDARVVRAYGNLEYS